VDREGCLRDHADMTAQTTDRARTWSSGSIDDFIRTRRGLTPTTTDRTGFGVSWNADLPKGGRAPSNNVELEFTREALTMDYLVDFTIVVPEGTADEELERRVSGEGARVAELAAEGHALRVWKPVPDDGRWRAVGLYRAADDAELDRILASLPLYPWMEITARALAEHPNDPGLGA
jgi:muconolactone D-isomerase